MTSGAFVPLAIASRSGMDESVHTGTVVCLGPSGDVVYAAGDPTVVIYPRSANKPLQAAAMVRAGLRLSPEQLALACASHDGTPAHIAVVCSILATATLDESALANTPDLPLDVASRDAVLRAGGGPESVLQNCSGKHAGMLACCICNDWPVDATYLDPEHPLQLQITVTIAALAGELVDHIGIDGCGAPAHAFSLLGLARAFASLAVAGGPVPAAMTTHPELVGGHRRDVTALMRGVPGLMAKDGAEGVFAAALPDGRAVALKIGDGASRARPAVMLAALQRLGVDTADAAPAMVQPVLGHGLPVGEVRASLP